MKKLISLYTAILILLAVTYSGCTSSDPNGDGTTTSTDSTPVNGDWIRIYHNSDPDGLHPFATRNSYASTIKENIYMYLLDLNPKTLKLEPTLAKEMPTISADGLSLTYEIRPEAKWDNGDPITGYDYAFSFKCVVNPLSQAGHLIEYHHYIKDIQVDPTNDKKFTILIREPFFLAETSTGSLEVISENYYDPKKLMRKFSFSALVDSMDALKSRPELIEFSDNFHLEKYQRDPASIYGSGPYKVSGFTTGDNVTLERKPNWWGDQLRGKSCFFQAYANKIIFKVVTDKSTLPTALKAEELDVVRDMTPEDFLAAREDTAGLIYKKYNFYSPVSYSNMYIAFNCRPPADRVPFFEDLRVRQALTHLMDLDNIIHNIYHDLGIRQNGPLSPLQKNEVDPSLKPTEFNPEKAKQLLDEAGWVDSNGDGVRDKMIKGKRVEMKIELLITNSTETGPRMARLIADQAQKIGVVIEVNKIAFGLLQTEIAAHKFDMYGLGFSMNPLPTDLVQAWHTSSWLDGSNYSGFGNAASDSLIEKMRTTLSVEERKPMYFKFQQMVNDFRPVVYVMAPMERIIIHKRFRNAKASSVRPGYKPLEFWVPLNEQKFK